MKKVLSIILVVLMLAGTLSVCVSAVDNYRHITFGSYPQSEVKDEETLKKLNSKILTWSQYNNWKYADTTLDGEKYRAVKLLNEDKNGYKRSVNDNVYIYWFKYEPLTWRVLDCSTGFIVCDNVIDCRRFDASTNKWASCELRTFMSTTMYDMMFTKEEKNVIVNKTLSDVSSQDNIFLLSEGDVYNAKYGMTSDEARKAIATSYAKSQGVYIYGSYAEWRLRSPYNADSTRYVCYDGSVYRYGGGINYAYYGVRPALFINLKSNEYNLIHMYGDWQEVEDGDLARQCKYCDYIQYKINDCGNHSFTNYISDNNATCLEDGTMTAKCDNCSVKNTITEPKSAKGHTPELKNYLAPTATENGYSGDYICSACKETISTGKVLAATGHVHTFAEWNTAIEPTCTESGLEYSICTGCYTTSFKKVDPTNHKDENEDNICDLCKQSLVSFCKHNYELSIVDATCTQKGTATLKCSLCKDEIKTEIPQKEHNYVDFAVAPTCEEDGYTRHICSLCGNETKDSFVKSDGHSIRKKVITPTCTENGCDLYICSVCGYNYFENEVKALGHTPKKVNAMDATSEKEGYTGDIVCDVCSKLLESGKVIPATDSKVNSVAVDDLSLNYKKSVKITPTINADNGVNYTVSYSSSNENVATVDQNGNIYGAKKGEATITCTVTDEKGNTVSDTCNVTVNYSALQWFIIIVLFGWIWY